MFNSGAEAVENAIKIARLGDRAPPVVAFEHAYHGRTNLAMGLTAKSMPYKTGFGPFAGEVYRGHIVPVPGRPDRAEAAQRGDSPIEKQIRAATSPR